ncbi:MAG: hypothetical protein ACT4OQ_03650 [Chloroflexota bacterium]
MMVLATLGLLSATLYIAGYFDAANFGGARYRPSFSEYIVGVPLWQSPVTTILVGLAAGVAGMGLLNGRGWSQILAIGIGSLSVAAAVALFGNAIAGWSQPGSFAVLLLPPAVVALLLGTLVLHGIATTRTYFGQ